MYTLDHRQFPRILLPFQYSPLHLDITEAIVRKTRMPPLLTFSFQGILIVMLPPRLALVASPFFRQCFGYNKSHFLSFFPTYHYFRKTGQILPHIQYNGRRIDRPFGGNTGSGYLFRSQLIHRLYVITFHNFDRCCLLRTKHPFGCLLYHYRPPFVIIESRAVPSLLFQTGVIVFPPINTIEYNRTQIIFPCRIGRYRLLRTVSITDKQFKQKGRRTETNL